LTAKAPLISFEGGPTLGWIGCFPIMEFDRDDQIVCEGHFFEAEL
jgi:hypothetical protein